MNLQRTSILAAVLALAAAPLAHAETSARGTVSNIGFELIDLDPNDGIIPSINFNVTGGYYFEDPVTRIALADPGSGYAVDVRKNATLLEPFSDSASYAPGGGRAVRASAGVSGRLLDGLVMEAQASSAGGKAEASGGVTSGHIHFILSPNSAVRITADLYATAVRDPALIDGGSYADVRFLIFPNVPEAFGYGGPEVHAGATYNPDWTVDGPFAATHVDYLLSNRAGQSSTSMVTFNAGAIVNTLATSPVPEPATWGMLLGGMGLLAAARRRLG
jgi:hypothetical protein